ncbi:ras GTPase-activating-like protein IQGAP1 [Mya arenaria]|uniref:ras GTPase-activating-like protein IQGAP1 n=1 Tax=Mya arenaria TaxID=6604 RepID=UPI0022E13CF6|nr:ras GTPase-activating-like protein IQGAP1 [Mya arenaria]XP_052795268.1 ras GTPase-activating-like protein IQGAP1 [Mya arenaria]
MSEEVFTEVNGHTQDAVQGAGDSELSQTPIGTEDKPSETGDASVPPSSDKPSEAEDGPVSPSSKEDPDVLRRLSSTSGGSPPMVAPKPKRPTSTVNDAAPVYQPTQSHGGHMSAEEMDQQRKQNIAYEYLCHLEESKVWIQACINEELPLTTELEEGLRNGVYLAKLAHFMAPTKVPLKRIYDRDQSRFKARGLHFRHTDNLNQWFKAMEEVGLPRIFYPETTDIYDRKNMPRTIYCLHALSLYLFKLGMAPQIEDLYGKVNFTEEEISAMRHELDKYGIQMPTFSKIGGILANELSEDDATLHAAIIAINEAIETKVAADIMTALGNPAARIVGINRKLGEEYTNSLYDAKHTKTENAKNKHETQEEDGGKEFDVYDEMLTQAELQGNLNLVNTTFTLVELNSALLSADKATVLAMLKSSHLGIKNVKDENIEVYMEKLEEARQAKKNNNGGADLPLDKEDIQQCVTMANLEADLEYQKMLAVTSINSSLETKDMALLMKTLQHPKSQLPPVHEFAGSLYMTEFTSMREEKGGDLDYEEVFAAVRVLSAVANINRCIDTGSGDGTLEALKADTACITNLDEENSDRYQQALAEAKSAKQGDECDLLTHGEISDVVEQVNGQVEEEQMRIMAISKINEYIDLGQPEETLKMLKLPEAKLENVDDKQAYQYQVLLVRKKKQKAEHQKVDSAELWVDEIQSSIDDANMEAKLGVELSMGVAAINDAIAADDYEALTVALSLPGVGVQNMRPDCAHAYLEQLQQLKEKKAESGPSGSGWMMNRTSSGAKFFFNTQSMDYLWSRNDDVIKDHGLLTKEEVQGVLTEVTDARLRELLFEANEDFIVKVQALTRGYLARKNYRGRLTYLREQEPAVVKIQAYWKGHRQKKAYKERLNYLADHSDSSTKLQSALRMWLVRKRFLQRLKYFKDHEPDIVKIQAFVRSNKARHDYRALMYEKNPPLYVVQRFVHLLDTSDADYAEELELQRVKQQVIKEIKSNKQLEQDLDTMDIKIGLLIKNRITLQDVVMLNKKLAKQREAAQGGNRRSAGLPKGLKVMTKESHDRMEHYANLFYLLQTNPTYLAKLIFEMPQDRTTKFMESVIYSLFNYGSNLREEYLLAKLFKTALEEEIISKVEKITDIVTGNPLVIKMIVGFNRNQRGQNALKEMLQPLVLEVIGDKNVKINTNPIEVYKVWINQMESETGKTSELPYDVSLEEALKHSEVQQKLRESTDQLQALTDKFLNAILQSLDKIPYGMRYMAKVLKAALERKFPDTEQKDVLKIVGNLLYYRYINPAIVSPDAFDIINLTADKALTMDQRRNLGSVAKVLQFAAANKGFGGDSSYLSHMNAYIKETHEKFKKYCLAACDVEEPEVKFNIDQYTDVTMITKPTIFISIQEIVDTHQLLLDHQDIIAPDSNDPIHELLEDLGDVPTGHELLGVEATENESLEEQIHAQLAKTEITLTLTNKFEVPDDDQTDIKTLLIRTKRMVVDVIACQSGDTLAQILEIPTSEDQEELHSALVKKRDLRDQRAAKSDGNIVRQQSMSGDCRLPLKLMKQKIKKSLQNLELANMVSRKDGYQEIINLIAQDIRNQRRYRNNRKQELNRLRLTLKSLTEKRMFYESQVDYYNQYVKTCTENLQQKGRSHKSKADKHARKAHGTIKYSGGKLNEKGVILEIEGLKPNQFKNAQFEIKATADPGLFEVGAKFMGVEVQKVEVNFQDLLQLQYEGVAVMEMFGKTKINVNLLIFLLNKKFYSSGK